MEDVMTYLDDQRKAMPEEVYLELGRMLADAKDTIPELFVVTWFSMSCNIEVSNDITTKRHRLRRRGVTRGTVEAQQQAYPSTYSAGAGPVPQAAGRKVWPDRSFPQLRETHGSQDCLITDMRPYRKRHAEEDGEDNGQDGGQDGGPGVNVDYMFGVEASI